MLIRVAQRSDIPALVTLWQEMMKFHAQHEPFFDLPGHTKNHYRQLLRDVLPAKTWHCVVAVDDRQAPAGQPEQGAVVGFCLSKLAEYPPEYGSRSFGFIEEISVLPAYRGQGVGRQLYQAAHRWFKTKGITRIELHAAAVNETSQAFWQRVGFQPYLIRMSQEI